MVSRRVTLKKGANIPDLHHVVRHVTWSKLLKDDQDKVLGILPQALVLRTNEEYLSVNWLEYFNGDQSEQLVAIKTSLASRKKVGPKSVFSIGEVREIKRAGKESRERSVRIGCNTKKYTKLCGQW